MNVLYEIVRNMIPVRMEAFAGALAGLYGLMVTQLFGTWSNSLDTLLMLMILDYASGMLAAYINPHLALNSQKGFRGIARKVFILVVVAMAHRVDMMMGTNEVITVAIWFYIGNEGLSIVENAAKAGVPIPKALRESLEQLAHEKKERAHEKKEREKTEGK